MGRQYGEGCREAIQANSHVFRATEMNAARREWAATVRQLLATRVPDIVEELDGIAEGSGLSFESVLAMNHVDTLEPPPDGACTSMAMSHSDHGPLLGKNNDGFIHSKYHYVVRKSTPAQGFPMVQITYAGWLSGLDALNAEGLANGHNSVGSRFDKSGPRVDIRLFFYHLMRTCRTTREIIHALANTSLTGKGFNVVLVDAGGATAVIEAAVPIVSARAVNKPFVFATNHYVLPSLKDADMRVPEQKEISTYRFGFLRWTEQVRPPITLDEFHALLRSHEPWAPCRHGKPFKSQTEWSIVAIPNEDRILVAPGRPCDTPYKEFRPA